MHWSCLLILIVVVVDTKISLRRVHNAKLSRIMRRYHGVRTKDLNTTEYQVQKKIINYHNIFRTQVEPPAANMLLMKWDKHAAKGAQKWANQCYGLKQASRMDLHSDKFGPCGQNIFISTAKVDWYFAMTAWFMEKDFFTYADTFVNHYEEVQHYTQMVWGTSHRVGCGWNECTNGTYGPYGRRYYTYICNYCPGGNIPGFLSVPYIAGEPCSSCPSNCKSKKLCTNSCNYWDVWENCPQLKNAWGGWLCNTTTTDGIKRQKFCEASCKCQGKIFH